MITKKQNIEMNKQHPFIAYVKSHDKIQKRTNPLNDNHLNANQG
jgi:hypothetical protein